MIANLAEFFFYQRILRKKYEKKSVDKILKIILMKANTVNLLLIIFKTPINLN